MAMTYMKVFYDNLKLLEPFTDEECGRLFKALLRYGESGEVPTLEGNERYIFAAFQLQHDREIQAYEEVCKKRSQAGKKSAEARKEKAEQNKVAHLEENIPPDDPTPYTEIMGQFNEICDRLPSIRSLDGVRRQETSAFMDHFGAEVAAEVFARANRSDFLAGGGDRGWVAKFDWIIKIENANKILEGEYDNQVQLVSTRSAPPNEPRGFVAHATNQFKNGGIVRDTRIGTIQPPESIDYYSQTLW